MWYDIPAMIKANPIDATRVSQMGEQVYDRLRSKLEARYMGKFVVIEVESGDYFVGDSLPEATQKGQQKYPEQIFYSVKVGSPTVYTFNSGATIAGPSLGVGIMTVL
jgi:hypothetical protein